MVIYSTKELFGTVFSYAKSDSGLYIIDKDGNRFVDAVYPLGDERKFTESVQRISDNKEEE